MKIVNHFWCKLRETLGTMEEMFSESQKIETYKAMGQIAIVSGGSVVAH